MKTHHHGDFVVGAILILVRNTCLLGSPSGVITASISVKMVTMHPTLSNSEVLVPLVLNRSWCICKNEHHETNTNACIDCIHSLHRVLGMGKARYMLKVQTGNSRNGTVCIRKHISIHAWMLYRVIREHITLCVRRSSGTVRVLEHPNQHK